MAVPRPPQIPPEEPRGGDPPADSALNHPSKAADKGSEGKIPSPDRAIETAAQLPSRLSPPMSSSSSAAQLPDPVPGEGPGAPARSNEGHGHRLTTAFEALEAFPALVESCNRLLALVSQEPISSSEVVAAVESDVALIIAVLRLANQVEGRTRGRVDSIV